MGSWPKQFQWGAGDRSCEKWEKENDRRNFCQQARQVTPLTHPVLPSNSSCFLVQFLTLPTGTSTNTSNSDTIENEFSKSGPSINLWSLVLFPGYQVNGLSLSINQRARLSRVVVRKGEPVFPPVSFAGNSPWACDVTKTDGEKRRLGYWGFCIRLNGKVCFCRCSLPSGSH